MFVGFRGTRLEVFDDDNDVRHDRPKPQQLPPSQDDSQESFLENFARMPFRAAVSPGSGAENLLAELFQDGAAAGEIAARIRAGGDPQVVIKTRGGSGGSGAASERTCVALGGLEDLEAIAAERRPDAAGGDDDVRAFPGLSPLHSVFGGARAVLSIMAINRRP